MSTGGERLRWKPCGFYDLNLEVTQPHYCHNLFETVTVSRGNGLCLVMGNGRVLEEEVGLEVLL